MPTGAETRPAHGIIRPDFGARPETERPQIVYYAGKSPKRGALLRMLAKADGKVLLSVSGGPENNNLFPVQIAAGKIKYALAILKNDGRIDPDSKTPTVIVAADVQAHSPILMPDGKADSKTNGKPEKASDVGQIFQEIIASAHASRDKRDYRYLIEAGSGARTMEGQLLTSIEAETNFFHIALEQTIIDSLATPDGTRLYLDELTKFLRSSQYLSNGLVHPGSPADISGALDLAVLEKLGAIRKINLTSREDPNYEKELRAAFLGAYVGFDMSVLEQVNPNARQLIENWPWPDEIMSYAHETKAA